MAKKKTEEKYASFSELNDALNVISPDGDILEDCEFTKIDEFISTGYYILNAAFSGSLFGGIPNRRSVTFAGEEGTGKTFLALSAARIAQSMGYYIIYYDSEGGIDIDFVKRLGVDPKRFRIENISTIEQFATFTAKLNNSLSDMKASGKIPPKILVVLDSLGNLSSTKEKEDTGTGSGKRDMTKQQAIRRTFRVVGTDFAKNAVPFIICNHVYEAIGSFFPSKEVSGGGGIKYNSSMIFMLTKSKLADKDSEDKVQNKGLDKHTKVGIVVTVTPIKQRFARPIKTQIHIPFYKKPNPYVGLENFVSWENCGIIRGKALTEKEYEKLKPGDQELCNTFYGIKEKSVSKTVYEKMSDKEKENVYTDSDDKMFIKEEELMYAYPKDTARSLVCKHIGGEVPLKELYTPKVFTEDVLRQLDKNVIKETFMLPSVENLDDLSEITEIGDEMSGAELDDTEII